MKQRRRIAGIAIFIILYMANGALAQTLPKITVGIDKASGPTDVAITLQIIFFLTILALAPSLLIMMTSFTRIIVVFSFLRHALGTQQMPPNQLLVGLALFLTFFVMSPVWTQINHDALQPYLKGELAQQEAFDKGIQPIRAFMLRQTNEKDLGLFVRMAEMPKPNDVSEIPTHLIMPAFVISELKLAFQIGFLLYIPFLVIDMIIAGLLMSMGMLMLPPVMISLPFKILLFTLADGWHLIVSSLISGFK